MKKRENSGGKRKVLLRVLSGVIAGALCLGNTTVNTYAYNYAMTGASESGEVIITATGNGKNVNGYEAFGGYDLQYILRVSAWTAFDQGTGGAFMVGNSIDPQGGCHFAYNDRGMLWDDGAIALGRIEGSVVSRNYSPASEISCKMHVQELSEVPQYIAYAYTPASGAYVHITEERGENNHVFYYQRLAGAPVTVPANIDDRGPELDLKAAAVGETVNRNGKVWATEAKLMATARDAEARPENVRIYSAAGTLAESSNGANGEQLTVEKRVETNGTYYAKSQDKLGNEAKEKTVTVDFIDRQAPTVSSVGLKESGYKYHHTIMVAASDAQSGLAEKPYCFNGRDWVKENEYQITANGAYQIKVKDALGNVTTKSLTVSEIDHQAPVISCEILPAGNISRAGEEVWSSELQITASAKDQQSGVASFYLSGVSENKMEGKMDESDENKLTYKIECVIDHECEAELEAYDIAGNHTKTRLELSGLDKEAPVMNVQWEREHERVIDGTAWCTSVTGNIKATDMKSGVTKIYLGKEERILSENCIDNKKTLTAKIQMDKNGHYVIWAEDRVGNRSEALEGENLHIDRDTPVINKIEIYPAKQSEPGGFTVDAVDQGCGLEEHAYRVDNGAWSAEREFRQLKNGKHMLQIRDKLGNTAIREVMIPMSEPESKPDIPAKKDEKEPEIVEILPPEEPQVTKQDEPFVAETPEKPATSDEVQNSKSEKKTANPAKNEKELAKQETIKTTQKESEVVLSKPVRKEEKQVSLSENDTQSRRKPIKNNNRLQKTLTITFGIILLAIVLAGVLYLLLHYLKNTCILYAVYKDGTRKRNGCIAIMPHGEEWMVNVPTEKLDVIDCSRYLIKFNPSFVSEENDNSIYILIEQRKWKEKITDEIEFEV